MIVQYEHEFVNRTCGSVRSSLSALLKLVTVWVEAAVTKSRHPCDAENAVRWFPKLRASTRFEGQAE
jgi:hypothetical protein